MKKKFDLNIKGKLTEDIKYYIDTLRQDATQKAAEIFEDATDGGTKTFNLNDILKETDCEEQQHQPSKTELTQIIAQLKQEALQISQSVFKEK